MCDTLAASDAKDPHMVFIPREDGSGEYDGRRLTEKEYAMLQGFPADYCDNLVYDEVTEEDLTFWREVFDTWSDIREVKHKTDKQIVKWLQTKPPKSAEYKLWGNGISLPIPEFILGRIAMQEGVIESAES